ncbi:MAG: hypothetical protein ACPL4H_04540 [Anaerolineales bacterium]
MSRNRIFLIIFLVSVIFVAVAIGLRFTVSAQARSPLQVGITIPYMGTLTDNAGQPVTDGNYDFSFALYSTESGGKSIWSEIQEGIAVEGGSFITLLGKENPLPQGTLESDTRWLEVSVLGPGESGFTLLSPRQALSTKALTSTAPQGGGGLSCAHTHWGETWSGSGVGLHLISSNDTPLWAESSGGWAGVDGRNTTGIGVYGFSNGGTGVRGVSNSSTGIGVLGTSPRYGVYGNATGTSGATGIYGEANNNLCNKSSCFGVYGVSSKGYGLYAETDTRVGVLAYASGNGTALVAENSSTSSGNLIEAWKYGTSPDRKFYVNNAGEVYADGGYYNPAADFSEMLPAVGELEPGDVLVIGSDGQLVRSSTAYQPNVVGVYSTNPGFVGGNGDDTDLSGRIPLAVMGVVPVKASAVNGPIQPGDLLVSSSIPGYAMKAGSNPPLGTVIGKSLGKLEDGSGMIQILVMLQ